MTDDPGWAKLRISQTIDELIKYGPSTEIGIGPIDGETITVLAQIDTGAAGTGISPRLSAKLNLSPIGKGEIWEAGREPVFVPIFRVRLALPRLDIETDVAGLPSLNAPHDVLIGRDILANCILVVDFTKGITGLQVRAS